jgi:hypothetical protein
MNSPEIVKERIELTGPAYEPNAVRQSWALTLEFFRS